MDFRAARSIVELANARQAALSRIGGAARVIEPPPMSVIVFGSLARGEADAESDIDLVVVRPDHVDEDDERWSASVDDWRRRVAAIAGNKVELLEASASDASRKLRGRSELWRDIKRDGIAVYGATVTELVKRPA